MCVWFFPKYELDIGIEMMWVHALVWLETDFLSDPWAILLAISHEDRAVQSTLLSAPVVSRQALS